MTEQFDQIDAQLARIEKHMATVWALRIAMFWATVTTTAIVVFALWWV